jgi:alpha-ribazole phosphatase
MEITLIRHTQVQNPLKLCYGWSDIPLSDDFEKEARLVKYDLNDSKPDQVYCSPSKRTQALAYFLGFSEPIIDNRLNELNFGDWELKSWESIPNRELSFWMYNYFHYKVPGGESFQDLTLRVNQFIHYIMGVFSNTEPISNLKSNFKLLIFTHSGPIRAFLSYFLKVNPYEIMLWKIPEGGIWKIKLFNDSIPILYPPLTNLKK